jgi:hypothetical protein
MHRATTLMVLLLLAACATPREACIADATRDQRVLERLAQQTRGNVARGYALAERRDIRTRLVSCTVTTRDGRLRQKLCQRDEVVTRTVPVSIDINDERAKLRSQERRLDELRGRADAVIRACAAAYPE